MKLSDLLQNVYITKVIGSMNIGITGIAIDSRAVKPGYIFAAIKGTKTDGHLFINDALNRGALCIITDTYTDNGKGITEVIVDSVRNVVWQIASIFYGTPGDKLNITGITGTDGKTTVSYLIHSIFKNAGIKSGVLGTIGYILGKRRIEADLTTPDIVRTNYFLREMLDAGSMACIMEVSSHALEQGRVDGIPFHSAVFTNLGRDHLDYHNTMEEYLNAKIKLFKKLDTNGWAVVNMDDSCRDSVIQNTDASVIGYGIRNILPLPNVDFRVIARDINTRNDRTEFSVYTPDFGRNFRLETKFIGIYNIYNILAAVSIGLSYGISVEAIQKGVLSLKNIPGRLQEIEAGQPFKLFIDYAHTPDALNTMLQAVRSITKGRLIIVFGCGGNRDKGKRAVMGGIASQKADYVIITTDNSRKEDPAEIINDIEKGIIGANYKKVVNRKEAIIEGLDIARHGDTVVIAGRGHEHYQALRNRTIPFNDKNIAEEFLSSKICRV